MLKPDRRHATIKAGSIAGLTIQLGFPQPVVAHRVNQRVPGWDRPPQQAQRRTGMDFQ